MLRIRVPGGILSPAKLKAIGQLAERFGQDFGELTTRQDVQLHSIELDRLPEVFALLHSAGIRTLPVGDSNHLPVALKPMT